MDYETKIYLDKLVEAVEKLDSPDWWVIGITVVNALIMSWLGWRQYKLQQQHLNLQEQQIKQQEYSLYNRLYKLVKDMDCLLKNHLYDIFVYYGPLRDKYQEPFAKKIEQVSKCINVLDESWVDFELKFPNETKTIELYKQVLIEMLHTYQLFHPMLSVEKEEKRSIRDILHSISEVEIIKDDNKMKEAILSLVDNEGVKDCLKSDFDYFLQDKQSLNNSRLLSKIAEHCRPEKSN